MTQTVRRTPGQRTTRRLGFVYAYDTLRTDAHGTPTTGIEVGYVGKTVQRLNARDDQHRGLAPGPDGTPAKCQPFADLIVGGIRVVEQGVWTAEELAEREVFHIHRLKPRYNLVDNPSPERIPIFEARRHRDSRDRAKGVEPQSWVSSRCTSRKPLSRPAKRRLAIAATWLASIFAVWLLLAALVPAPMPWQEWPILSAGLCTEPLVFLVRLGGKRKTRNLRRWLAGLSALATVVLMVIAA